MSKIEQLQASLVDQQLDAAYISDPMTIGYLTGFYEDPIERVMALVVFADAEPFLFTPARNRSTATSTTKIPTN